MYEKEMHSTRTLFTNSSKSFRLVENAIQTHILFQINFLKISEIGLVKTYIIGIQLSNI